MIIAELEIYHSRPIAPTRRVALGRLHLPVDPPPGPGAILLGAVVANFIPMVHPDNFDDLWSLVTDVERGVRIPQPRLRHRFQNDRIGLTRSRHRLIRHGADLRLSFTDHHGAATQHVLGAVYAAGRIDYADRPTVMEVIRRGIVYTGELDDHHRLIAHLSRGSSAALVPAGALTDPVGWALGVLGLDGHADDRPGRDVVQRRFRSLLRDAHPDHGGATTAAADRIAELAEARRILLP